MSLPSIPAIKREFGLTNAAHLSPTDIERILVEAMRRDLPLGIALLHDKAHAADADDTLGHWIDDPNSSRGKQLIRIHASDALRQIASKHFCHGKQLSFVNCCKGKVGNPPTDIFALQIETQDGTIASADC